MMRSNKRRVLVRGPEQSAPTGADRTRWRPSVARRTVRRPVVWWALLGLGGTIAVMQLAAATNAAEAARTAWGERVEVAVVTESVTAGDGVSANVEWREIPAGLRPAHAVARTDLADGATARREVGTGEILVDADLASPGDDGGVRPGETVGMTIGTDAGPGLVAGDRVDLLATYSGLLDGQTIGAAPIDRADGALRAPSAPSAVVVAREALVVSVDADAERIGLAVDRADAATLAHALARATVLAVVTIPAGS